MSAALPVGMVTFLLTDVEGSTTGWESGRNAMAAAVVRHYEIDLANRAQLTAEVMRPRQCILKCAVWAPSLCRSADVAAPQ